MDIAKEISKGLSERIVIAKVNGELWDLERPLEGSVSLELIDFEHPDGLVLPCASVSVAHDPCETQESVCSGIHLLMSSVNPQRSTTDVICALVLPRMTVSSMKWPSTDVP